MKRWIAISILALLLIASLYLHTLRDERMLTHLLTNAGHNAAYATAALSSLREGQMAKGIAILERFTLEQLEIAAQRRESLAGEVDFASVIGYFRGVYGYDPLEKWAGPGTSHAFASIKATEYGDLVGIGDLAPALQVQLADGTPFDLAKHRGQIILVVFFATWCGPCREELPSLDQLAQRYQTVPDFTSIAVGHNHTCAEVAAYAKSLPLAMPAGADPGALMFQRWARTAIPRVYVVDRQGRVVGKWTGTDKDHAGKIAEVIDAALSQTVRPDNPLPEMSETRYEGMDGMGTQEIPPMICYVPIPAIPVEGRPGRACYRPPSPTWRSASLAARLSRLKSLRMLTMR